MMRRSVPCSIRIPATLYSRMDLVIRDGGRYKGTAQFITTALHRLVTFEEGELAARTKTEAERAEMLAAQISIKFE